MQSVYQHSKRRVWEIVNVAAEGDHMSRAADTLILSLIFLNVVETVCTSVEWIQALAPRTFQLFEVVSVMVFSVEYAARVWSSTSEPRFAHPLWGRLRFMVTPMALIDLFAILPFYLMFVSADLRGMRSLRLLRVIRLAKIGRYYPSLRLLGNVLLSRREEFMLTSFVMFLLLIVAASLMYIVEHPVQPDQFPDIPTAMWWAVATLTTVGYGDVYPITSLGRLLASVVAILGIGFVALPTGILGAGFVEELERQKEARHAQPRYCPHCGNKL